MMSLSSVLANDFAEVNQKVVHNFNKEFALAKNIQWTTTSSMVKVSFTLNEQSYYGYYSQDGERIAISRRVAIASLPLSLNAELQAKFDTYWITDAFEIASKDESAYYVTVENADNKLTLKSSGLDSWSTFKKTSKE